MQHSKRAIIIAIFPVIIGAWAGSAAVDVPSVEAEAIGAIMDPNG